MKLLNFTAFKRLSKSCHFIGSRIRKVRTYFSTFVPLYLYIMLKVKNLLLFVSLVFIFCAVGFSQTPVTAQEEKETIVTEEIKLNVSAFNGSGEFVSDVQKEDLVIIEDGRLQQANSIRRVPASVLIALDTGGEMRANLRATRQTAKNLVNELQASDRIALMQYGDKAETLSDWTIDKIKLLEILDKKLAFGKRSVFNQALGEAIKFFARTPAENRHLILITNGADSFNDQNERIDAAKSLTASGINVHVISYTQLQQAAIKSQKNIFVEGQPKPRRLPEEVVTTLPDPKRPNSKKQEVTPRDMARMPRLGSIIPDRERRRRGKADAEKLEADEQFLTSIAEDTDGEVYLPESFEEITEKTSTLAKNIDSQYVITYIPKRPLKDSPVGEIRQIEVSAKRAGLQIQARRKFVVEKNK